ncbi:ATP-binding protein [Actinosynnema sp. CS-041913]|uniref:ATP-binding protein n=1 Tax=Actinosynnema sp. CS-041913 TaxID=3239917 RepID=UPI003D8E50FF
MRNAVSGPPGVVVQAGAVHGGVTVHPQRLPAVPVVPRQVPAAPELFTGRVAELALLDGALVSGAVLAAEGRGGVSGPASADLSVAGVTVVISAIGGPGGIGKTWLALAWANRNLGRFPDGQLFVDLRGFSPVGEPVAWETAVRGFLDALGVDPDRLPAGSDARAALYRSLVAGRRMLVVLDNAATAEQVVPLLPGGRSCTVLVTSRNRLAGLVARHGARPLPLGVLPDAEAHALLASSLGAARVAGDERAVGELIALCGGFPLALGIVAARTRARPGLPLAEIVAEVRESGPAALDDADPAASLPGVLSWSLRHLTAEQRRVFALLSIAPGPDTGIPAAAALAGFSREHTVQVLGALENASLIDRHAGGRYAMHDLIRAYAATLAHSDLAEPVRREALERVVDFYLHTAHTAQYLLEPEATPIRPEPAAPAVRPHPLPDPSSAMAWFDAEHAHLLAAQRTAARRQRHHTVWHLAWNLVVFHWRRGHRHSDVTTWRAALDAATRLPDPARRIRAHRHLGRAHSRLGQHAEAAGHLHQALVRAEHHHDTDQQAATHNELALASGQRGDHRKALDHARRAVDLYRTLDKPISETAALSTMGLHAAHLGDHDTARDHCQAALALLRHHHTPRGEAGVQDVLGLVEHHTGHHHQAIHHHQRAATLYREVNSLYDVADVLDHLGHPHTALGRYDQARTTWQEALELYRQQGRDTDTQRVQQQLDTLDRARNDTIADAPSRNESEVTHTRNGHNDVC